MDLKLPFLGEGVDAGTVVALLVKEGEDIAKDQGVIELETGKAVAAVPASVPGKVTRILVAVGDKVSVGQPIVSIAEATGAAAPATAPVRPGAAAPRPAARPAPVPQPQEPEVEPEIPEEPAEDTGAFPPPAAPAVRRIARELGISLRKIRGSERGGRIVMQDLRNYVARLEKLAAAASRKPAAAPAPSAPPPQRIDFSQWGPVTFKPISPLRKVIAQRMIESTRGTARVTQFEEADITELMDLRKKYADTYDKKGARLTITSFALKVVADALKRNPMFNASIDEVTDEIVMKEYYHIGLAVDTEQGLVVPVIRNVDKKDLVALSKDVNDFAAKTRERRLGLDEVQGGTFTISNQGGIGGGHFTPIVNKPEVAILGMGRGALKAVVRNGKIEARFMLPLALSYDHRLIDGGAAVRFMTELVQGFEKFPEEQVRITG